MSIEDDYQNVLDTLADESNAVAEFKRGVSTEPRREGLEQLLEELVQVAAVAHATGVDLLSGTTGDSPAWDEVALRIRNERWAQEAKWGSQTHNPTEWLAILVEEVGEVADAIPIDFDLPQELLALQNDVSRIGAKARKFLENHEWPEERHRAIHEAERESKKWFEVDHEPRCNIEVLGAEPLIDGGDCTCREPLWDPWEQA